MLQELHTLLTRHLSNTYNSEELEEMHELGRIMPTLYYRDKTRHMVRPEVYRSHRQAILCSATIPQRYVYYSFDSMFGAYRFMMQTVLCSDVCSEWLDGIRARADRDGRHSATSDRPLLR